jgi:hypothetical protein
MSFFTARMPPSLRTSICSEIQTQPHYTFFSLHQKKPEAVMKIKQLREDGIGDLLVELGLLTEQQKRLGKAESLTAPKAQRAGLLRFFQTQLPLKIRISVEPGVQDQRDRAVLFEATSRPEWGRAAGNGLP